MNTGILTMLELAGLRNQNIGQAVLEGLTADPLRKTFAAVLAEICKGQLDDSEQWIVANVLNRVDKLTQARNTYFTACGLSGGPLSIKRIF